MKSRHKTGYGFIEPLIKVAAIYVFSTGFHVNVEALIRAIVQKDLSLLEGAVVIVLSFALTIIISVLMWKLAPRLAQLAKNPYDKTIDRINVDEDQILSVGIKLIFILTLYNGVVGFCSEVYYQVIDNSNYYYADLTKDPAEFWRGIAVSLTTIVISSYLVLRTGRVIAFIRRVEARSDKLTNSKTANKSL